MGANPCKWPGVSPLLLRPSTSSSRLAPGRPVPLTCRRSVAGCHIFQPRDLAEETLARLCRSRQGARGRGPASHLGWVSAGCASRSPATAARWARGTASRSRRRGARLPATCGHGRAPAVLAQLREDCAAPPGPASARRRRGPLPPPPPPPPPPGPARSEHARGQRPPGSPHPRLPGTPSSRPGECGEASTDCPAPRGTLGSDGVWERGGPGEGGFPKPEQLVPGVPGFRSAGVSEWPES